MSNPSGEGESSEEEHDLLDVVNHAAGALGSGLVSALKFTGDFLKGDVGPSPGARARSVQVSARRRLPAGSRGLTGRGRHRKPRRRAGSRWCGTTRKR